MVETAMSSPSSPFLLLLAGILGLVFGSFANALITRVPTKESLWTRSRCNHCKAQIATRDNIPVISYLLLHGRCRSCHGKISIQYPVVEMLSSLLFIFPFLIFSRWEPILFWLIFTLFGLPLFVIDLRDHRLPDRLTFSLCAAAILVAIGCAIVGAQLGRILYALIGAFSLALFYFIIALVSKGGMGMGDVKLALSVGFVSGFFSAHLVIVSTFVAFGLGSTIGLLLMATGKATRKSAIPFGPFMILAQFLGLLLLPGQYF